jgi:hypothetical protein
MVLVLLGLGLADCKCKNTSTPANTVQPGVGALDETASGANLAGLKRMATQPEWMACTGEGQCVHAPADCCGCAGGGTDLAINFKNLSALAGARDQACSESVCAAVMSKDLTCMAAATCINGFCRLKVREQSAPKADGVGVEPIKAHPGAAHDSMRVDPSIFLKDPPREPKQ